LYTNRRDFLRSTLAAAIGVPRQRGGKPRGSEFVFARLRYESGDWDYNPKVAANVLDSVLQYTTIPVYRDEVVISAASTELFSFPFVFMTGHKLVRFTAGERENLRRFADAGGLLFSDDCNHDVNALYAKSFEDEMRITFPGVPLAKLPATHPIYGSFFKFTAGPPQTSHELNGWGDNIVHEYLRGIERRAPRRALQQQGLRLVGLRLAEQALPAPGQHEGQRRRLRHELSEEPMEIDPMESVGARRRRRRAIARRCASPRWRSRWRCSPRFSASARSGRQHRQALQAAQADKLDH
jgi:hypothetical protein